MKILTYQKYKDNIEQLKKDKETICKMIDEYLLLNFDKYFKIKRKPGSAYLSSKEHYIGSFDFLEYNNNVLMIKFYEVTSLNKKNKSFIYLESDDFNDFKKFTENPSQYKSIYKYNL